MEDESDEDLYITQNVFTSDKVSDSDCQLDLDAVIELAYSVEESESEVGEILSFRSRYNL